LIRDSKPTFFFNIEPTVNQNGCPFFDGQPFNQPFLFQFPESGSCSVSFSTFIKYLQNLIGKEKFARSYGAK